MASTHRPINRHDDANAQRGTGIGAGLVNDKDANAKYKSDTRPETAKAVAELKRKVLEVGVVKP